MQMPMGAHKGKPIEELPTAYLAWVVSQDAIRFSRWALIEEIVRVLIARFSQPDKLLDELRVSEAPPARQETAERKAERQAERQAERAEKLRQLEKRRLDERLARREAWRAARDQADMRRMAEKLRERLAARNKGG